MPVKKRKSHHVATAKRSQSMSHFWLSSEQHGAKGGVRNISRRIRARSDCYSLATLGSFSVMLVTNPVHVRLLHIVTLDTRLPRSDFASRPTCPRYFDIWLLRVWLVQVCRLARMPSSRHLKAFSRHTLCTSERYTLGKPAGLGLPHARGSVQMLSKVSRVRVATIDDMCCFDRLRRKRGGICFRTSWF